MERQYQCLRCGHDSRTHECEQIAHAKMVDLQRALDAERTAKKAYQSTVVDLRKQLATLQAQLAALTTAHQSWTEVLGEWLWNCTNLLGDYNIKTADDFNIELNRRVMWLTNNLEHTLTPPVTREEQQQIQDLTHTNARLKEALQGMLKLVDDGLLVRNIANDHIAGWWIRALPIVQALRQANEALQPKEATWHAK